MKDTRRLHSGRVSVRQPDQVSADRYQFLDLASAEPNLGTAANGRVLTTDTLGTRTWTANLSLQNATISANLVADKIYSDNIYFANGQPFISDTTDTNIYNGTATAGSSPTLIDTVSAENLRSVKWIISAKDVENTTYKSSTIDSVTDGSTVYYNEYGVVLSSNAEVAAFTANISSGNVNLYALGDSNNVTITYQRTTLGSATIPGFIPGAGYIQNSLGSGTATTCVNNAFTGTGSQTNFTLSSAPTDENQTIVSVGGVLQPKSAYSVSGTTLTLSSAPANGVLVDVTIFVTTTITGYTGSRGYTGSSGVGYTGSQGLVGYAGSVGTGYTGSQGSTGYTGSIGSIGYTGSVGPAAATYSSISGNVTAVAGTKYIVDSSFGNVTITLPSSPVFGQEVGVIDGTGNASTNVITINGNGAKIQGSLNDMTVNTNRAAFTLVYYNSAQGWLLTNV